MRRVFPYRSIGPACTAALLAACTSTSQQSDLLQQAAIPSRLTALPDPLAVRICPPHNVLLSTDTQMLLYVRAGDTLLKLARCHRSTVAAIMAENRLTSDRLVPDQILAIRFAQ